MHCDPVFTQTAILQPAFPLSLIYPRLNHFEHFILESQPNQLFAENLRFFLLCWELRIMEKVFLTFCPNVCTYKRTLRFLVAFANCNLCCQHLSIQLPSTYLVRLGKAFEKSGHPLEFYLNIWIDYLLSRAAHTITDFPKGPQILSKVGDTGPVNMQRICKYAGTPGDRGRFLWVQGMPCWTTCSHFLTIKRHKTNLWTPA